MKSTSHPKRYRLKSEPGHFYTGHLKDDTQIFMSLDYQNLISVLFDAAGMYLKYYTREFSQETQNTLKVCFAVKYRDAFKYDWDQAVFNKVWEELDCWAEELGFVKGVISIQKFSLPEFDLCIQDLPGIYQEMLDSGSDIDDGIQEEVRYWHEVNDYVLVWGQEYEINREGEVVST